MREIYIDNKYQLINDTHVYTSATVQFLLFFSNYFLHIHKYNFIYVFYSIKKLVVSRVLSIN